MSPLVIVLAVALAAADASAPAPSVSQKPDKTQASGEQQLDPNRIVCRKEEVTGSRFEKRVCMPQSEWDQMTASAQRGAQINNQRAGMGETQSNPMGGT